MKLLRPAFALAVVLVVAACAAPGASIAPSPTSTPAAATPAPSAAAPRIEVSLSDEMKIEPSAMTVSAGVPVTFVVTNAGSVEHEFYLGDEQMQADHEAEMSDMGGMMGHDEANGITLDAGETKELTYTFESAGTWLAGCHVPGHYPAGMKATITIE